MSLITLALILFLLMGCSNSTDQRQQALEAVKPVFAEGAINIQLTAEPLLNAYKEIPNSVTLFVIQAENKTQLENVLNNPSEIRALFNGATSSDNRLKSDRYNLMPGQQHTLHIDRAMNIRQVAVIAGYYPFPDDRHITRFDIPVKASKTNWWSSEWQATLTPLTVSLTLGKDTITRIEGAENRHKTIPKQQGVN
ncbi:type VI secretion system lipoprotein TssJ [Pantoea sp. SS70]|uniref:type VI secretion system lipoprotein TssJ n=1 Tax=Pantoea sp. SS70 TaxID=3024247 RepID=UPI002452DE58|nr:type VI secretion system lipoprotein TssJ [Pantoea sp. SS70]WGK60100.1 type VI secretion system lipoprotein TssJ [Pantoea sp. SS70]